MPEKWRHRAVSKKKRETNESLTNWFIPAANLYNLIMAINRTNDIISYPHCENGLRPYAIELASRRHLLHTIFTKGI